MSCIYKYKGKDYTKDEFYSLVRTTMVQPRTVQKYKKILFPKGETAAKIEGHETIADEVESINNRINELSQQKSIDAYSIISAGSIFRPNAQYNDNYNEELRKKKEQYKDKYIVVDRSIGEGGRVYGVNLPQTLEGITLYDSEEEARKEAKRRGTYNDNRIKELEQRKQALKTQGIEKLKPIEAFYEIKVGRILEKQFGKDNVKTITDEYGNQWREVKIEETMKEEEISLSPLRVIPIDKTNIKDNLTDKLIAKAYPTIEFPHFLFETPTKEEIDKYGLGDLEDTTRFDYEFGELITESNKYVNIFKQDRDDINIMNKLLDFHRKYITYKIKKDLDIKDSNWEASVIFSFEKDKNNNWKVNSNNDIFHIKKEEYSDILKESINSILKDFKKEYEYRENIYKKYGKIIKGRDFLQKKAEGFYDNQEEDTGGTDYDVWLYEENKFFKKSEELIKRWKRENNIQYNPEEAYERGYEFVHSVGAYATLDLMELEKSIDNSRIYSDAKNFVVSAYTANKNTKHLSNLQIVLYPNSSDILWASKDDIWSGMHGSEGHTKYPSINNLESIVSSVKNAIEIHENKPLSETNELGIVLQEGRHMFRYTEDATKEQKDFADEYNKKHPLTINTEEEISLSPSRVIPMSRKEMEKELKTSLPSKIDNLKTEKRIKHAIDITNDNFIRYSEIPQQYRFEKLGVHRRSNGAVVPGEYNYKVFKIDKFIDVEAKAERKRLEGKPYQKPFPMYKKTEFYNPTPEEIAIFVKKGLIKPIC